MLASTYCETLVSVAGALPEIRNGQYIAVTSFCSFSCIVMLSNEEPYCKVMYLVASITTVSSIVQAFSFQHLSVFFSAQSPENPYSLQGGYDTVTSLPPAGGGAPGPPHHHPGTIGSQQGPYRYHSKVTYF